MEKKFDCVAMKDTIQERHAREYAGMSPTERWTAVEAKLATSDDTVARKWRLLKPSLVHTFPRVAIERA